MAELELSLTRRGYVVIPWQTIARSADRAPLDVARQLGADVLFQVHSLERTEAPAATDAELVRSYFESDMYGQHGAQLDPGEMVAAQLRELAQVREVSFAVQIVHGVALDVQAIAVPTGQTIWLYQWRMAHRDAAATSTETLAVGRVRPEHVERLRQQEQQPTLEMRAWSATAPVTMPGVLRAATDPGRDVPSWLVQRLVDDLASRFQTGVGTIERGSMPNGR